MARKRNNRIQVRLTDDELHEFEDNVKASGLGKEGYLRKLIKNIQPGPMPSDELVETIHHLRKIGNNLNQIAYKANINGDIDKDSYQDNFNLLQDEIDEIMMMLK